MMIYCTHPAFLPDFRISITVQYVDGHGILEFPFQRGELNSKDAFIDMCDDKKVSNDYFKHFPAEDKNNAPGSAHQ